MFVYGREYKRRKYKGSKKGHWHQTKSRLLAEGVFILSSKVSHTFIPKNISLEHPTYRFWGYGHEQR